MSILQHEIERMTAEPDSDSPHNVYINGSPYYNNIDVVYVVGTPGTIAPPTFDDECTCEIALQVTKKTLTRKQRIS